MVCYGISNTNIDRYKEKYTKITQLLMAQIVRALNS